MLDFGQAGTSSFESSFLLSPLAKVDAVPLADDFQGIANRQQHVVDAMAATLLDFTQSAEQQAEQITGIQVESGCTTLEGRMLYMFALDSVRRTLINN